MSRIPNNEKLSPWSEKNIVRYSKIKSGFLNSLYKKRRRNSTSSIKRFSRANDDENIEAKDLADFENDLSKNFECFRQLM